MTPEDYLYLQYCMRNGNTHVVKKIQMGEIKLPPVEIRTKEDVFRMFGGDINYKFDLESMC